MKKLIVANWKMYLTLSQSVNLAKRISNFQFPISKLTMVLCPSFVALEEVSRVVRGTQIKLGAQDVEPVRRGAYTGEVGLDDLRELGVQYVLVGHSERRRYFGETDAVVNAKLRAVLKAGMRPILCVGESSRPNFSRGKVSVGQGAAQKYVAKQLRAGLKGVPAHDLKRVVVAYEPVWAIGTGRADSPEDSSKMHGWIRKVVKKIYGGKASGAPEALPPVLYGGSVNSRNAKEFLRAADIDGLLIGKASTNPAELHKILNSKF